MSEYYDYYAVRVSASAALLPALNAAEIETIVFDDLTANEA